MEPVTAGILRLRLQAKGAKGRTYRTLMQIINLDSIRSLSFHMPAPKIWMVENSVVLMAYMQKNLRSVNLCVHRGH